MIEGSQLSAREIILRMSDREFEDLASQAPIPAAIRLERKRRRSQPPLFTPQELAEIVEYDRLQDRRPRKML